MKRALILVAFLVFILGFAFILYGCDSPEKAEEQDNDEELISEDPDEQLEEHELPEGISVYPEATLVTYIEDEDEDIYEYQTLDSREDVFNYYVAEFEAAGHEEFFNIYDDMMAEVQVRQDDKLFTVTADSVNEITEIIIRIR